LNKKRKIPAKTKNTTPYPHPSVTKPHPAKEVKPYSGKLMLRIPSEVHARAAMLAEAQGKSLNQWATDVFKKAS
jgi:hypothetical protein